MYAQSTMLFSFVSYCEVGLFRQKIKRILSSPLAVSCTPEQPVQTQRCPDKQHISVNPLTPMAAIWVQL